MTAEFAPKGVEEIKAEVLEDLGEEYEGNEEKIDRVVARRLKDEEFKASVHKDKVTAREKLKETRKLAGLDPETGEKIKTKVEPEVVKKSYREQVLENRALNDVHEDDIEEIVEYAERKKITLFEAKKSPLIQAFLQTRAEERKSAEATNLASLPKRSGQTTEDKVLDDLSRGVLPETEEAGAALAKAQFNNLLKGTK